MTRILFFLILFHAMLLAPTHGAPEAKAAVDAQKLDEWTEAITEKSQQSDPHDAYKKLVAAGTEGWRRIFQVEFDVSEAGDLARHTGSLWGYVESDGITDKIADGFFRAERAELERRTRNETWALLYAAAYERSKNWRVDRRKTKTDRLQEHVNHLKNPDKATEPLLATVAFLRVNLVDRNDFPGHTFPWHGTAREKTAAVRAIEQWWTRHREEFKNDD